ncbi:MAG: hypothetical protein GX458_18705 [Phyllobacteriaceae bacterium]|nr:hypothetical protein [Phyllobacteriaceae bacterium]
MTAKSTVIALLGASLFFVTSAATATLAVDRERTKFHSASDPASCPPQSCSVVIKTAAGGAPSRILAPAAMPRSGSGAGFVLVAQNAE